MYILAILQVEEECVFEKIKNHRGTAFMIKELSQNQPVRYSRRDKKTSKQFLLFVSVDFFNNRKYCGLILSFTAGDSDSSTSSMIFHQNSVATLSFIVPCFCILVGFEIIF